MGRLRKNGSVPFGVFYLKYFLVIFLLLIAWVALLTGVFLLSLQKGWVYPANYAEQQARQAEISLQTASEIRPEQIPPLNEYAVFDRQGRFMQGNLNETEQEYAWQAVQQQIRDKNGNYYLVIERPGEYCVLQYRIRVEYQSDILRTILPGVEVVISVVGMAGAFFIVFGVAFRFGKVVKKRLQGLIAVAQQVQKQQLDFSITPSGIQEVDTVLESMDQMRNSLKESLEQQWKSEQEKNRQMAALAHDLKTPLTIVRGNGELLAETTLSPAQEKYVAHIQTGSLQMQQYVQTLIEVTKSQQGIGFCKKQSDCQQFLQRLQQQAAALCQIKQIKFCWNCSCCARQIFVDEEELLRAILNVVANAAEHTDSQGMVELSVHQQKDAMQFVVTDTGTGFSQESLCRGTEAFYTGDSSRNSKTHFGIGLYTANLVLQRHGGSMRLENRTDVQGARVVMEIPC